MFMRMRWRFILPTIGLLLFMAETSRAYRGWQSQSPPRRYLWWSTYVLDSDPLNRHTRTPSIQKNGNGEGSWDLRHIYVDPGVLSMAFALSGFPAFHLSWVAAVALSRFGISQIITFMISTPILLTAWYYFLGWLVDRWRGKP